MTSPIATLDYAALARSLLERSEASLSEVGAAIGVEIAAAQRDVLLGWSEEAGGVFTTLHLPLAQSLSLLHSAIQRGEPFVFFQRKGRFGHTNVLLCTWSDGDTAKVTMGGGRGGPEFVKLWHGYNNTTKKKPSYHDALMRWVKADPPSSDAIVFTVRARPAPRREERGEEELLREIFERPEDDEPRLVLADLLVSRGDPRGELIHLQVAETAASDWGARMEIREKIDGLLTAWFTAWAGTAEPYAEWWCLRRGFIDTVVIGPAKLVKHAGVLFRDHPIQHVHLTRTDIGGRELTKALGVAEIARLRSLVVKRAERAARGDRMAIGPLGTCPLLGRVERLAFYGMGRDAADWEELWTQLRVPSVRHLALQNCGSGPDLYAKMAESADLVGLESFSDVGPQFTDGSSAALADAVAGFSKRLDRFGSLSVGNSPAWDDDAVGAFFTQAGSKLRAIDVRVASVTDDFVRRLRASPSNKTLERFTIYDCPFGSREVLNALIDASSFPNLHSISITGGVSPAWDRAACDDVVRAMLALPSNHPLRRVSLSYDPSLPEELEGPFKARFGSRASVE